MPEAVDALRALIDAGPHGLAAEGEVLRRSRYRLAARVDHPGLGPILLKAHRVMKRREALLSRIRSSRARAEWEASRQLSAAGVAVPPPLGYGEVRRGGRLVDSFFVARFLDGRSTVHDALEHRRGVAAHELQRAAAGLIRAMHDAGFDHRDLHAGNMLADSTPAGRLVVVDLHRYAWRHPLPEAARIRGLAKWCHSVTDVASRAARWRMLVAYAPEASRRERQEQAHRIAGEMARIERIRRRSRAKRCLLESTVYTRDVGAGRGARRRDLALERLDALLGSHDEALAARDQRVAKLGRKSRITRHGDAVVKEVFPAGFGGRLKDALAPNRRNAGYRNAHLLDVLEEATARPLAWVERGGRSYTLYEDLSALPRFDRHARSTYRDGSRADQVRLRDASADWLRGLHVRGIYHGDLKGVNVLVADDEEGVRFPLIDTDRVRLFPEAVDRRRVVKNLAQLAASIPRVVTRTERLRWFRRYARGTALAADERGVARDVAAHLARKILVVDEPIE